MLQMKFLAIIQAWINCTSNPTMHGNTLNWSIAFVMGTIIHEQRKPRKKKRKRSKEDKNIQLNGLKKIYGHVCNYFHK